MAALKSYLKLLPLLASLCLAGCDDVVFTKGEVVAKRKYESVKKGDSRDAVVRALEVAVDVPDAGAAGVLRLPDLPAVSAGLIRHDEPVVPREAADEGKRRVP